MEQTITHLICEWGSAVSLDTLVEKVQSYHGDADVDSLARAYKFAEESHEGQFRDSGEPYFSHPYHVALILAELQLDTATLSAGLLHDVLEDTGVTRSELESEFGHEICLLVDGVTKLRRLPLQSKEERQAESLRKMFLAMAEDIRVVLIKLADRLHNMRTLRSLTVERQKKIARETLEIYTPLAHRLGMSSVKWEMEDCALRYLDPDGYYDLAKRIAKRRHQREGELLRVSDVLETRLDEMGITASLSGRPKHLFSIYNKMQRQGKALEEIYDLMAVRVIVDNIKDCYGVLGLVHTLWKPIPSRFKDYIAVPKSNLYQSLHTTVIGPSGEPIEVQIRTKEMHRIAEMGVAAHWLYKEGSAESHGFEQKVAWLRQVMDWLREMKDPREFMETLRIDLFVAEVFVFTPKGDVKSLPAGATPVDFAFSVHTDIGMHCAGAKVNGRLVPLQHALKNGDIVEVVTSKQASPSRDWLGFVKTSKARNKIRNRIKEAYRDESAARGRELLEREVVKLGAKPETYLGVDALQSVAKAFGLSDLDDLYAGVGYGNVSPGSVLTKLVGKEELETLRRAQRELAKPKARPPRPRRRGAGVRVKGVDDLLVRFSRCCNPVPGDPIVGYITRGRGVSVHRTDCPNAAALSHEPGRTVPVEWNGTDDGWYPVEIEIKAEDRINLLSSIMFVISEDRTTVESVHARTASDRLAYIHLVVGIRDVAHMEDLIRRVKRVAGVESVGRSHPS